MRGIFWEAPAESYSGSLPDRADILVIGGGIAGTSLMHHLARRRFSAVLVESRHLAFGASGRNAGFLLAGVADCYAEAVRIFGRSKAREVWQITDENHDRMIEAVAGVDVGYRRLGSATFASGEEERTRLEESAQMLADDGFVAWWDGSRLLNPRDGEVDPAAVVGALAGRLRAGVIREGLEVTSIVPSGEEVTVRAGESECRAGVVVLATNGYTSLLLAAGEDPADPRADARFSAALEVGVRHADVLAFRLSILAPAAERGGADRRMAGHVAGI